jgi:hypothetical protein
MMAAAISMVKRGMLFAMAAKIYVASDKRREECYTIHYPSCSDSIKPAIVMLFCVINFPLSRYLISEKLN